MITRTLINNMCTRAHLVSIVQEPVVEESVREEEVAADNGKVEKLTEHKSAKIDVVSEKEGHVYSIMLCCTYIFNLYICSFPLTCYEYFCRKTGLVSPASRLGPQ